MYITITFSSKCKLSISKLSLSIDGGVNLTVDACRVITSHSLVKYFLIHHF